MSLPRKLKNFILFNDGNAYLGEVPSVTLPKLSLKTEEYRAGGMDGPVELDLGTEVLTLEWTAAGWVRTLLAQWGTPSHNGLGLRFTGAVQADDDPVVHQVEVVVRGRHKEIDFGESKVGEMTEHKVTTTCSYYRLSMDGVVLIEIDVVNMIKVVNGVDLHAAIRQALGL